MLAIVVMKLALAAIILAGKLCWQHVSNSHNVSSSNANISSNNDDISGSCANVSSRNDNVAVVALA